VRRFSSLSRLALRAALLDGEPGKRALAALLDKVDFDNAKIGVWRLSPLLEARARAFLDIVETVSPTVLIKGGATLVRFGSLGNLRPMGDLDILVQAQQFRSVVRRIMEFGWKSEHVAVLADPDLPEWTPGAPFIRAASEIYDLHWSPLHDIADPALNEIIFANSVGIQYAGRTVRVPAMHHHLALLLLHADQGETQRDVARVDWACEAVLTLRAAGDEMDWSAFEDFARSHGLQVRLRNILNDISDALGERIGNRASRSAGSPLLALEQQLRGRTSGKWAAPKAAFLAFQRHRRTAGWSLKTLIDRGELFPALARAQFAALDALNRPPAVLARQGRGWAQRWRQKGRLRAPYAAGWSWPEVRGGRWSDGKLAVFSVPTDRPAGSPAVLMLSAFPFLLWPNHPVRVTVDAGARPQELTFQQALTTHKVVPANVGADGHVTAGLVFDLPDRDSNHLDHRRLALFVSSMAVVPLDRREFPVELDLFGGSQPAELGPGWSQPEDSGTWTVGQDVYVTIALIPGSGRARLELDLVATAPGDPVMVAIAIADRWRKNVTLDATARTIQQDVVAADYADGTLGIHIHVRNPRSPHSLGLSSDGRDLGLHVSRIVVRKR
jgi:hypothetical protein